MSFLQAVATEMDGLARDLTGVQDAIGGCLAAGGVSSGAIVAIQDLDRLTQIAAALAQVLREVEPDPDMSSWQRAVGDMTLVSLRDRLMSALGA